jgi:hypothetical protein
VLALYFRNLHGVVQVGDAGDGYAEYNNRDNELDNRKTVSVLHRAAVPPYMLTHVSKL